MLVCFAASKKDVVGDRAAEATATIGTLAPSGSVKVAEASCSALLDVN